jgi:hypothetical protein
VTAGDFITAKITITRVIDENGHFSVVQAISPKGVSPTELLGMLEMAKGQIHREIARREGYS